MANQNQIPIGNSGSLEDCHTNLYALTDIAGIQYAKFISYKEGYINSLDDPILVMYTKCLNAGILCSWNKAKKDEKSNLSDINGFIRELWVFWYDGNDPFSSKNITIPNSLREEEKGNWKNGLTYEIRSILFKALNIHFERYFLSKGFMRMGPWIQMPYKPNKHSESQYGFNLKFFLHGESTICGAIDVRNVSMVRQIVTKDILNCNNQTKIEVILAPYAVRAFLTGHYFKDDDPHIKQLYEDWLKYYPLVFGQNSSLTNNCKRTSNENFTNDINPPKFVEIITGNCKMKYPSCLVCIRIDLDKEPGSNCTFSKRLSQKENRKRRFSKMEVPDGNLFSFVARRFSDRILKETMIPLNNKIHKESSIDKMKSKNSTKPWKYSNPFCYAQCCCTRFQDCGKVSNQSVQENHDEVMSGKNLSKTFHQRLLNLEIPFTKTLPLDNNQTDFGSTNKMIPPSKIDSSCDRCNSPVNTVSNIQPNDPIMPTLSPQLPSTSDSSFLQFNAISQSNQLMSATNTNNSMGGINVAGNKLADSLHNKQADVNVNNFISHLSDLKNPRPLANTILNGGPISSRTPPPPSITPSSMLPHVQQIKLETCHSNDLVGQVVKSELSESIVDKKSVDSLPLGIEINEKLSHFNSAVTNVNVSNKNLFLHRKPVHNAQSCDNISDITLFPPLANNFQTNDILVSTANNDHEVNYGLNKDKIYQDALINNKWLMFKSFESTVDGSPVAKRLKNFINHNRNVFTNNFYNSSTTIMDFPSQNVDSSNTKAAGSNLNSTKNFNVYSSIANEKSEQNSVIPDQIFDDSDEEDNLKTENTLRTEMQISNSDRINNSVNNNSNNNNERMLSPNSAQLKVFRSNPFGKFSGTSLHSSSGSGCISAVELSLMYPTPPSLEGTLTSVGSPAERQSANSQIRNSNLRNSEYNHSESLLNSLSINCQNWEEMDKDWGSSACNASLFSSGVKYSKQPESSTRENLLISFNHKRLHQRNKMKHRMNNDPKLIDRYMSNLTNLLNNSVRRPNNLIPPTPFYPQMPFTNPSCCNLLQTQQNFPMSRLSNIQRFPLTTGQNSAPMTPASVCTNPPSVESSIGTPRNIDHINITPNSSGFSRPQAVQSSPVVVKSPRTQSHVNSISSMQSNLNNFLNYTYVNGLYLNVLLSDSILNLYKDHNFDSCNICVCSMSVLGNDVGLYIDEYQQNSNQNCLNRSISNDDMAGSCTSKTDCKCGFSAVINRHYAINSNLFYEDEVEITGIRKQHIYSTQAHMSKDCQDNVGKHASSQLMSIYDEFGLSFLLDFLRFKNNVTKSKLPENLIEFQDFNAAIHRSLDQASESSDVLASSSRIISPDKGKQWLSKLYYFKKDAVIPKNYNDQIRLLMTLRPLLQEAVSNTRLLESSYTVDGPLTWKTFHRLAGRGNVESCEPQPLPRFQVFVGKHSSKDTLNAVNAIPGLSTALESNNAVNQASYVSPTIYPPYSGLNNGFISGLNNYDAQPVKKSNNLGYFSLEGNPLCLSDGYPDKEKECLTISPYAVREWDKLNLEPIYRPKEVAYVVVTPTDSGKLLQNSLVSYFKEVNHAFESCRLGHHFSYRCNGLKDDIDSFIEINTEEINDKRLLNEKHVLSPESLQKYWVKELSQTMSVVNAEEFISKLVWYVKCCEQQTVTMLSQYGVHKRNGTKSALFSTCDSQKRDMLNINQSLEMLFSPGNGCGSLGRGLNTKIWSSDMDLYLIVYLINPFVHGQDVSEPAHRLSMQRLNKLCDRISDCFHQTWKSRITFHILPINRVLDAVQFGSKTGIGDGDGSSLGGRDSSVTSAASCTSSSVSWSVKWCRQYNWKSTAFAIYNSIRRKVGRVSGLQTVLSGKSNSSNLCSSAKCSMARGCSSDDECESAASLINANRCLTKCGPTGYSESLTAEYIKKIFLHSQEQSNLDRTYFSIYAPSYILAPLRTITYQVNNNLQPNHSNTNSSESWGYVGDKSNVLFVSYCLSVDQRWLLATCTDQLGTLFRHKRINISVPQLHLMKNVSPRRIGFGKLWDFIQEVIADTCQPWRLVIGRMGRAGHGELKGWNGLLSRQNLIKVNQRFRDECSMCQIWYTNPQQSHGVGLGGVGGMGSMGRSDLCALQAPAIISGCFVSLECHSSFRIFPGSVKPEERASSNLQLCTPRDISVTHILVFPTSTSAGADQDLCGGGGMVNEMNLEELLDIRFGNEGLEELGNMDMSDSGFPSGFDSYPGIGGLNPLMPQTSISSQHDLVSMGGIDPSMTNCMDHGYQNQFSNQEEGHMLMQQPLAMGYYLSTTDPGPLPSWFWSACPPKGSTENQLPTCFKAALHLQTSLINQEDGSSGLSVISGSVPHPLDSHQTCDVLRFVLESYHSLSWLTYDPSINDRRSCLPIHILCLAQLYQADQMLM